MIGHFLNNSIAVCLNKLLRSLPGMGSEEVAKAAETTPSDIQMLIGIAFLGIIALVMAAAQIGLLSIINERSVVRQENLPEKEAFIGPLEAERKIRVGELWPLIPAAMVFLVFVGIELFNLVAPTAFKFFS